MQEMGRAKRGEETLGSDGIQQIADVVLHPRGNLERSRGGCVHREASRSQRFEARASHEARRTRDEDRLQRGVFNHRIAAIQAPGN